jgi:serine/threonine protein kinase
MQAWRLGSYELLRRLGEGGMAQVYLARDTRLGREVAIKVLDQRLAERPGFRERFLREARVAAALDHPNIVPLYDFGESEQLLYLVMPYVSGGSLQDMLHRTPLPVSEVTTYGSQMADALDYAHQRGVVHRDVKPANMLLHADGRVLLSDFGLAKIINPSSRPTAPRGHPDAGTPEYMAPEQIEGRSDARSDIYALGVVLYLLLTGQLPFTGSTSSLVMEGHLYRLPEQPRMLNPAVTPAMQTVVLRALAKHPLDRYQSASELGAALLGALIGVDNAPPPILPQGTPLPVSRPPLTPRVHSGALGWEPPAISAAPPLSGSSGVPLPPLDSSPISRGPREPDSFGSFSPGQRSGSSGAYILNTSNPSMSAANPPVSNVRRTPAVSRAPTSSRRLTTFPPQPQGMGARPTFGPAMRQSFPPTPAAPQAPPQLPLPRAGSAAQSRISIRSGMSQRVWIVIIVALIIGAIAAGILLNALQNQPAPPSRGLSHGVPSVQLWLSQRSA